MRENSYSNVYFLQNYAEVKEVAKLHIHRIQLGFLSKIGENFLIEFYEAMVQSEYGICLIAKKDTKILGFIGGVIDLQTFYRNFIRKRGIKISFILSNKLFKPQILYGILENIFHLRKLSKCSDLPKAELISVAVNSDYEGKGIGSLLLKAFLGELKRRNINSVKVHVGTDNKKALRYYKKHKFINKGKIFIHKRVSYILVREIS